jgi:hypothetical protein
MDFQIADHASQAAADAVKAVQAAGGFDNVTVTKGERVWQWERLPVEIRALIRSVDQ